MSEEERLELENELLMTKSKATMINMYLDVLSIIKEVREVLHNKRELYAKQLLYNGYFDYEEVLFQLDEEIGMILDKGE